MSNELTIENIKKEVEGRDIVDVKLKDMVELLNKYKEDLNNPYLTDEKTLEECNSVVFNPLMEEYMGYRKAFIQKAISKEEFEKTDSIMDMLGITALKDKPCRDLSGGQRQLVAIGRALLQDTRLLLMDEPTSALDIRNQVIVLETIDQLRAQGYAIIFTTHLPEQALLLNSRVGLCRGGSIDFYDSVSDVTLEALEEIYKTKLSLFYSDTVNRTVCVIPQLGQKGM